MLIDRSTAGGAELKNPERVIKKKITVVIYKDGKPTGERIEVDNTPEKLYESLYGHSPKEEKDMPEEF